MKRLFYVVALISIFVIAACGGGGGGGGDDTGVITPLEEDRTVYDQDNLTVKTLNVTITGGATIEEVNADDDWTNPQKITALVTVAEPGNVFITKATEYATATGKLRIRGHTSREADIKSYRIKLDQVDNELVLWRNLRTLQLNKHPWDLTRLRNKLSFDFFKTLPNMASLRTLFVHLYIDSVDYGLYTLVERSNELFLEAHGLDAAGWLYKAEEFSFERDATILRNTDDPDYNKATFETVLEIRGEAGDHSKLIAMLTAVNDEVIDINTIIEEHFQRDNYLTWFATNILLENDDTNTQNFFLYSPTTHNGWYFLPWDYDGAWGFYAQPNEAAGRVRPRWTQGVANWWFVILHQRFLKDATNVTELVAKVQELRSFFTASEASSMLNVYRDLTEGILTVDPDLAILPALNDATDQDVIDEWNGEIDRIPGVPEEKYQEFMTTIERPMPIWLDDPSLDAGEWYFSWDASYDLQGDAITYDFQVSTTRNFDPGDIVVERLGLTGTEALVDEALLPPGTYYYRITIRDSAGNWQYPFDYIQEDPNLYDGMKEFTTT